MKHRQTYEITIPGLSMRSDFATVRDRLLADFPGVLDVLPMTTQSTVQVLYTGPDDVNGWIDALCDSVAARRMSLGHGAPTSRDVALGRLSGSA